MHVEIFYKYKDKYKYKRRYKDKYKTVTITNTAARDPERCQILGICMRKYFTLNLINSMMRTLFASYLFNFFGWVKCNLTSNSFKEVSFKILVTINN